MESRAWGIRIIDDLGQEITLSAPAMRIISLYGGYNEILGAMGLEERLVGRTKADRLPPSILSKPSIGTHMRPNVEMILGLNPDLAIQMAGRREALAIVHQIQREGIQVAVFHPASFASLFSVIQRLGIITGQEDRADGLLDSLRVRLERVQSKLEGISHRPTVFFEVRYPNLLGAGRESIVTDIIRFAGGINCLDNRKKLVRVDMEALIGKDPEVYLVQKGPMNQNPSNPSSRPHFRILRAVRDGRVMVVDEQAYSRPGPRSVDAVEELAAFLHPKRF